jgi:uncharacterized membrane protein
MGDVFWGILMIGIGLFLSISGWRKSEYPLYRLLVARSQMLWGDNVHRFYQVVGILIVAVGILLALRNT